MDKIKELLYQFAHKRITTESFEEKIYEYQDLEILLRPDDYLFLISANYKDVEEVEKVRHLTKTVCDNEWPGYLWDINKSVNEIDTFLSAIPSEFHSKFSYCLINMIQRHKSWSPDLPEGCGFILMASPPDRYKWALYAVRCSELKASNIHVIPDPINRLLTYAETYPPALALARSKVARIDLDEGYAESQFLVSYSYLVLSYLENRNNLPFFKATNRVNEWGYRRKGESYWIVGYRTGLVNWVSSDYHVYTDDITGFQVSEDELRRFK